MKTTEPSRDDVFASVVGRQAAAFVHWVPILAFVLSMAFVGTAFGDTSTPTGKEGEGTVTFSAEIGASSPIIVDGREAEEIFIISGGRRLRLTAEIADTPDERSTGLMFREDMPADHGMLFDFERTDYVTMWMQNTPMSLDMVFIRPDGTIVRIEERTTPFSTAVISSGEPVSHVLELKAGVSRLLGIKPGDRVEHNSITSE